jgi:MoxR-like ATPase
MSPPTHRFVSADDHGPLQFIDPAARHRGQYGDYIVDTGLLNAANTALGLELPLLLTGEPGCGKSDFAWVAAHALELDRPLCCYIRSDTRARDLLYHYDALGRFGDAQHGRIEDARDPRNYIRLRPLGVALMRAGPRQVVLIDEIDKAPRDLPNDLLRELDEGHFEVSEIDREKYPADKVDPDHPELPLRRQMSRPAVRKPFIVITSNAERQLPEPFLRRCVFYHIPAPKLHHLIEIAARRFPGQTEGLLKSLATVFFRLREHAERVRLSKLPTIAEMLEWMRAVTGLIHPEDVRVAMGGIEAALRKGDGA